MNHENEGLPAPQAKPPAGRFQSIACIAFFVIFVVPILSTVLAMLLRGRPIK